MSAAIVTQLVTHRELNTGTSSGPCNEMPLRLARVRQPSPDAARKRPCPPRPSGGHLPPGDTTAGRSGIPEMRLVVR